MLFEDFLKDVNRIAASLEKIAEAAVNERKSNSVVSEIERVTAEKVETLKPSSIVKTSVREEVEISQAYEDMDRISLVAACRSKGVSVPKGTRDKTLIAKLKSYDKLSISETATDFTAQEVAALTSKEDADPFDENVVLVKKDTEKVLTSKEDADPFDENVKEAFDPLEDDTVPEHTKYTLKEVRAVLQKVMLQHGKGVIKLLLETYGGVNRLKDLAEKDFSKVVEASEKYSPNSSNSE